LLKGQFRDPGAVQAAVRADHLPAKMLDDLGKDWLAGLHEGTAQLVGLDDFGAKITEIDGHGRFTAAQAPG
jgi:hypothetical protein